MNTSADETGAGGIQSQSPLRGKAAQLVLNTLFLEPTTDRLEALKNAALEVTDWSAIVSTLELHGVLPIANRNLTLAEASVPEAVLAALRQREEVLRADARCYSLTLARFLDQAERVGVRCVVLKGSSLAIDLYGDEALRSQADVDVLVRPEDVGLAVRAGAAAGLVPDDSQLPAWWYRLAHFHLKLHPTSSMLREVEVHWKLHSPALLLTLDHGELWVRCRPTQHLGRRVWQLSRTDRLLHLMTHLLSHWYGTPAGNCRAAVESLLAERLPPVRLKWLLDLVAEIESIHGEVAVDELVQRAQVWGASREAAAVIRIVREGLGLSPDADEWAEAVVRILGTDVESAEASRTAIATDAIKGSNHSPMTGIDFRAGALRRLPTWMWPPASYLRRRYPAARTSLGALWIRSFHLLRTMARFACAALSLPAARLGSWLLRAKRRRLRRQANDPDRILDLVAEWRSRTTP